MISMFRDSKILKIQVLSSITCLNSEVNISITFSLFTDTVYLSSHAHCSSSFSSAEIMVIVANATSVYFAISKIIDFKTVSNESALALLMRHLIHF